MVEKNQPPRGRDCRTPGRIQRDRDRQSQAEALLEAQAIAQIMKGKYGGRARTQREMIWDLMWSWNLRGRKLRGLRKGGGSRFARLWREGRGVFGRGNAGRVGVDGTNGGKMPEDKSGMKRKSGEVESDDDDEPEDDDERDGQPADDSGKMERSWSSSYIDAPNQHSNAHDQHIAAQSQHFNNMLNHDTFSESAWRHPPPASPRIEEIVRDHSARMGQANIAALRHRTGTFGEPDPSSTHSASPSEHEAPDDDDYDPKRKGKKGSVRKSAKKTPKDRGSKSTKSEKGKTTKKGKTTRLRIMDCRPPTDSDSGKNLISTVGFMRKRMLIDG